MKHTERNFFQDIGKEERRGKKERERRKITSYLGLLKDKLQNVPDFSEFLSEPFNVCA